MWRKDHLHCTCPSSNGKYLSLLARDRDITIPSALGKIMGRWARVWVEIFPAVRNPHLQGGLRGFVCVFFFVVTESRRRPPPPSNSPQSLAATSHRPTGPRGHAHSNVSNQRHLDLPKVVDCTGRGIPVGFPVGIVKGTGTGSNITTQTKPIPATCTRP